MRFDCITSVFVHVITHPLMVTSKKEFQAVTRRERLLRTTQRTEKRSRNMAETTVRSIPAWDSVTCSLAWNISVMLQILHRHIQHCLPHGMENFKQPESVISVITIGRQLAGSADEPGP